MYLEVLQAREALVTGGTMVRLLVGVGADVNQHFVPVTQTFTGMKRDASPKIHKKKHTPALSEIWTLGRSDPVQSRSYTSPASVTLLLTLQRIFQKVMFILHLQNLHVA